MRISDWSSDVCSSDLSATVKNRLRNSTFASLLLWSLCAQAAVTAQLDREQMQPGESVQLNLERDGSGGAEPDLSPRKKDFDVLGRSSGSSIQIINGSISRHKSVRVTLSPKRSGTLTIPPISWGGEQTRALQIMVTAGGGSQAQANGTNSPHVLFTTTLDESQPYVQSALLDRKSTRLNSSHSCAYRMQSSP